MDKDNDGLISFKELKATRLGKIMRDDQLKTIMKKSAARKLERDGAIPEGHGIKRKGSMKLSLKNLPKKLGTGRGKEVSVMEGAIKPTTEEEERKFFDEMKKKQEEGNKTNSAQASNSLELLKTPQRGGGMNRRGSFMNKMQDVASGGVARSSEFKFVVFPSSYPRILT